MLVLWSLSADVSVPVYVTSCGVTTFMAPLLVKNAGLCNRTNSEKFRTMHALTYAKVNGTKYVEFLYGYFLRDKSGHPWWFFWSYFASHYLLVKKLN